MKKKLILGGVALAGTGVVAGWTYGWWQDVRRDFWGADLSRFQAAPGVASIECCCGPSVSPLEEPTDPHPDCPIHGDDPFFGSLIANG